MKVKIYIGNKCVPCARLKQWLADAKRDTKYNKWNDAMQYLHSIVIVNVDIEQEKKEYLIQLGVKSVPCMIEQSDDMLERPGVYLGYDNIVFRLEEELNNVRN